MRYEVSLFPPEQDTADPVITDAAGVSQLVRQAAQTGRRVHIRPIAKRLAKAPVRRRDEADTQP